MSGPSTSPFTAPAIAGYNASPPPDDGSATEANRIKWSTIKTKLDDPVKTLAEAAVTACTAAFAKGINSDDGIANSIAGNVGFESDELTIASGSVTPNRSHHTVDTESDAASDDLANVVTTNMATDAILILRAAHTDRSVVLKHAATGDGELYNAYDADITLDDTDKTVIYQRRGADWYEIARNFVSPGDMGALGSEDKVNDKVAVLDATDGMVKYATMSQFGGITAGTKQASTSGTAIDFTGIPSGVNRVTITFEGVSLSGTDNLLVQIGDAGGFETSAYVGNSSQLTTSASSTSGFIVISGNASRTFYGHMVLARSDAANFTWVASHSVGDPGSNNGAFGGGNKSLSAELTQVRVTRTGTDTFDAGAINILYE